MEQERIPFDIKYRPEIEAGKYLVVTKAGREVRITQWEWLDEEYPIIAYIKGVGGCLTYTDKGEYIKGAHTEDINLFLVPIPDYKEPTAEQPSVDWDAFRREAAKDFVAAYFANPNCNNLATESIIKSCITAADELIWNLKKKKK